MCEGNYAGRGNSQFCGEWVIVWRRGTSVKKGKFCRAGVVLHVGGGRLFVVVVILSGGVLLSLE